MQRRLAAILAADVVGYSARMGEDEAATLAALRALRAEVLGPTVGALGGRVVKSLGDGWLVEFGAAADAVACAMRVQDRLDAPGGLRLRIGVHLGDVTHEEDDVFGDGVNVAARLEAEAAPGGIAISDPVYGALDGTLRPSFDDGGERALKNIARPVRVWLRGGGATGAAAPGAAARMGFPRLAVRPVTTSDARDEVRELAEALTGDVVAYLGAVRWLDARISERGGAEGAYDLSAALRARGERLRLEVRLAGPGGRPLLSAKFDGALGDAFDWQDRTGEEIATTAAGRILDEEHVRLVATPDEAITAEQCFLAGLMAYRSFRQEAFEESLHHLLRAIERNPDLADAYANMIFTVLAGRTVGFRGAFDRYARMMPGWVETARRFAGLSPMLDLSLAIADFQQDGAAAPLRHSLADLLRRAPFDSQVLAFAGWGHLWIGDAREALDCFERQRRLDRQSPYGVAVIGGIATAKVQLGDDAGAIEAAEAGLAIADGYPTLHAALAAAHALRGERAAAEAAFARYRRLVPERTIESWKAVNDYGGSEGGARYFEGLRRAGMPEA
ncbi:MAG: adenylate/guanylate cyclase domain-containing protein [Paracoccaceae bacterium]